MFFAQSEIDPVSTGNVADRFPGIVGTIAGDAAAILPELILCFGVCWVLLADLFRSRDRSGSLGYHAFVFVVLALVATLAKGFDAESRSLFSGMIVDDGFGVLFKVLMLVGTLICIPMTMMHREFSGRRMGEYYALLLGSVVGMFLMVSSRSLLMFYLGVEFASITCYLLTAYVKDDRHAAEGGLKYVIYGSVASGLMIYGLSFIYGLTGTLDVAGLSSAFLVSRTVNLMVLMAALLAFAGFAYKIAAFPMHFWCPDAYQGAAVPFTAFLSVVSKAAGFGILIRFVWSLAGDGAYEFTLKGGDSVSIEWPLVMAVVSLLTMTVGNLAALFQTNMKRLLAYSSIAHAGYLLMGVAALGPQATPGNRGWEPVVFYLIVYLFMNLGAFLVVSIIANRTGRDTVAGYAGMGRRNLLLASCLTIFLLSLIGLPPTGGFSGKFQLLEAAMKNGFVWLAVAAGLNTAISVYYYWRIVKVMFLDEGDDKSPLVLTPALKGFVIATVIPVFYLGIFFSATVEFIRSIDLWTVN